MSYFWEMKQFLVYVYKEIKSKSITHLDVNGKTQLLDDNRISSWF